MGKVFTLVFGGFILLGVLIPNPPLGRIGFLFVGGSIFALGALLYAVSVGKFKKTSGRGDLMDRCFEDRGKQDLKLRTQLIRPIQMKNNMRTLFLSILPRIVLGFLLLTGRYAHGDESGKNGAAYPEVRAMGPVGYWPMDEGDGDVLHDRSGNGNDGKLINTDWEDGLADFIGGYQWAEIPASPAYESQSFTIGGWLLSRKAGYGGGGSIFVGIAGSLTWLDRNAAVYLRIRDQGRLEVFSGGKTDALGSGAGNIAISAGQWQLVLYTREADGTAKLYIDGRLAQSAKEVPLDTGKMKAPLLIGPDSTMWGINSAGSLNGSVRDIMLFDRALAAAEVEQLFEKTRPKQTPGVLEFNQTTVSVDGMPVDLNRLSEYPLDLRLAALRRLLSPPGVHPVEARRGLRAKADFFRPVLIEALGDWPTAHLGAEGLRKIGDDEAKAAMREAVPKGIGTLRDPNASHGQRMAACATLGEMHGLAQAAVPALTGALEALLEKEGVHLPRVEDHFRNSLLRALLNIDRQNREVRRLLDKALAKPFLDVLDLGQPYLDEVKALAEAGRYMDALDACRKLKLSAHGDRFFTQNDPHRDARTEWDPHRRSYTPTADYAGYTYRLGGGKAYEGATLVSPEAYREAVEELATEYPAAAEWRPGGKVDNLYRLKIIKTDANGNEETSYLEGEWLVFNGSDAKVHAWSIGIDKNGYLHIMGGQHNAPNPEYYIPGGWERMGLSRERKDDRFPRQLYWVSKEPGSIDAFEFVGGRHDPRHLPPPYWNYMNFVQDNQGELYVYGRINVSGIQSFGMYRYHADTRRWSVIGGDARDIIADSEAHDPGWTDRLVSQVRGRIPREPGEKALAWAWQPHFYNYCRAIWGVRFDPDNRMHVELPIHGLVDRRVMRSGTVYAYSDDGGQTFHRADGSPVNLPLTTNPAPAHNADLGTDGAGRWWRLYRSLVEEAGY